MNPDYLDFEQPIAELEKKIGGIAPIWGRASRDEF